MNEVLSVCKAFIYAMFIFLGINYNTVMLLFILMMLDSVLGAIKALRLGRKFSFKILVWGLVTKLGIFIVPMVVALIGKALNFDFHYFIITIINIIVVSEGISCITNIISIKTGKQLENNDYITRLLLGIRSMLIKIVEKFLKGFNAK